MIDWNCDLMVENHAQSKNMASLCLSIEQVQQPMPQYCDKNLELAGVHHLSTKPGSILTVDEKF